MKGLGVIIATTAYTDEEARSLLTLLGMPFREASGGSRVGKEILDCESERSGKFRVRAYHRCQICGRPRGYLRKFQMCRICFRLRALRGEVPGVIKASW